MTIRMDSFYEAIRVEMKIHDVLTGNNLLMVLKGTDEEVSYQLCITSRVMVEAGFRAGWREHGPDGGFVDHLVVVREATERRWKMQKANFEAAKQFLCPDIVGER